MNNMEVKQDNDGMPIQASTAKFGEADELDEAVEQEREAFEILVKEFMKDFEDVLNRDDVDSCCCLTAVRALEVAWYAITGNNVIGSYHVE